MRAGQVSSVMGMIDHIYHHQIAPGIAGPVPAGANVPRTPKPRKPSRSPASSGPAAVAPAGERRGLLSRLKGLFHRS